MHMFETALTTLMGGIFFIMLFVIAAVMMIVLFCLATNAVALVLLPIIRGCIFLEQWFSNETLRLRLERKKLKLAAKPEQEVVDA